VETYLSRMCNLLLSSVSGLCSTESLCRGLDLEPPRYRLVLMNISYPTATAHLESSQETSDRYCLMPVVWDECPDIVQSSFFPSVLTSSRSPRCSSDSELSLSPIDKTPALCSLLSQHFSQSLRLTTHKNTFIDKRSSSSYFELLIFISVWFIHTL